MALLPPDANVEIDTTFDRIPWRRQLSSGVTAPEGIHLCAKVPQVVTHQKVLIDTESDLKAFLG